MGHSAATARHYHESQLFKDSDSTQATLADRSINPNPQDVCRLFDAWRKSELELQNENRFLKNLKKKLNCTKKKMV